MLATCSDPMTVTIDKVVLNLPKFAISVSVTKFANLGCFADADLADPKKTKQCPILWLATNRCIMRKSKLFIFLQLPFIMSIHDFAKIFMHIGVRKFGFIEIHLSIHHV